MSVTSIQGKRPYMEDRYAYINRDGIVIAMVCDGHGGDSAAEKTVSVLPERLFEAISGMNGTNSAHAIALRRVIMNWGSLMRGEPSGSTLTGVAIKNGVVYVYNIGDSRTCIKLAERSFIYFLKPQFGLNGEFMERILIDYRQKPFFCTVDNDPSDETEVARIVASGGKITGDRLNGILSVTRALGDKDVGVGLSYVPDLFWFKESDLQGPIIMYSDGVYEPQRYRPELNFDNGYLYNIAVKGGSKALVNYAYSNGSEDNITVLILTL